MGLDMLVASAVRWVALLAMAAMLGALVVDTLIVPRAIPGRPRAPVGRRRRPGAARGHGRRL